MVLARVGSGAVAGVGLDGLSQAARARQAMATRRPPAEGLVDDLRAGGGTLRRFEKDTSLNTGNPAAIERCLPRWTHRPRPWCAA